MIHKLKIIVYKIYCWQIVYNISISEYRVVPMCAKAILNTKGGLVCRGHVSSKHCCCIRLIAAFIAFVQLCAAVSFHHMCPQMAFLDRCKVRLVAFFTCNAFLQREFSNGFSKQPSRQMQSRIGCIWTIYFLNELSCDFPYDFSEQLHSRIDCT